MDAHVFVRGAIIGLSIAAPVGPIGILCIRRSLTAGRAAGLATGLAATIAAFGITSVASLLLGYLDVIRLVGGLALLYLGWKTFRQPPLDPSLVATGVFVDTPWGAFVSTLAVAITNPVTILLFAGIFAGLGVGGGAGSRSNAALLVVGGAAGSAAWWFLLSGGADLARRWVTARVLQGINRAAGLIILGFAIYALIFSFALMQRYFFSVRRRPATRTTTPLRIRNILKPVEKLPIPRS